MADSNGYTRTYTGLKMFPLTPTADMICIKDIAHALSQVCRWSGHTKEFYSVAQHCVYVSYKVPENMALTGLLHDASEAYLSDIVRPLKHSEKLKGYLEVEAEMERVIADKFGLTFPYPPEIKQADNLVLETERRDICYHVEGDNRYGKGYDFTIVPLPPKEAEKLFLERFYHLTNGTRQQSA